MAHISPYVVQSAGQGLQGISLGFHAYSLRVDNLSNQWLQEQSSLAWIPPYSLGVVLRLYGTSVALLLIRAPTGQPQLTPVTGEYAVAVFSDEYRNEVAGVPVREFSLVQAVSDLTRGPQPALPPNGVDRLYADTGGTIHHLHADGTDLALLDSSNVGPVIAAYPLGGDLYGTVNVGHVGLQFGSRIYGYDSVGTLRGMFSFENNDANQWASVNNTFKWWERANTLLAMQLNAAAGNLIVANDVNTQSLSLLQGSNQVIYWRDSSHYLQYAPAGSLGLLAWTHNFQISGGTLQIPNSTITVVGSGNSLYLQADGGTSIRVGSGAAFAPLYSQDVHTRRNATQGAVFFGSNDPAYIFFDGSQFSFQGGPIYPAQGLTANTVARSALQADALVRKVGDYNNNSAAWSTSATGWQKLPVSFTATYLNGKALLWTWNIHLYCSIVNSSLEFGLGMDNAGTFFQQLQVIQVTTGNQVVTFSGAHVFSPAEIPGGGSHTFECWLYNGSGTVNMWTNDRQQMSVTEVLF